MLNSISLPALRVFEAVARCGSFRAAAADLALSPSAVSHAIDNLEASVGVLLFERAGRHARLTVNGELLAQHVSAGFAELRRGFEVITAQKGRGLLRIHAAPSFASCWLSPRLPRFLASHPGIEVRLSAGVDYARFTSGDFDIDIVYGPIHARGAVAVPVVEEVVTPLCAPALAERIRTPRDLLDHALILSDNKQVRWPHWFEANGMTVSTTHSLRFDRSFLAIGAAADGLGVALESTFLAQRELARGTLVAPLAGRSTDIRYVGHHLVHPGELRHRAGVRVFIEWLQAEIAADARLASAAPLPLETG